MSYYLGKIRFNKNKSKNSGKKQILSFLVTLTLISLLVSAPTLLFPVTVNASTSALTSILDDLGFTNIALTDIETFPPGIYNVTLYAEFARYHDTNELSYYPVGTSDFQTIFTGPEGATGFDGGYVVPPLSRIFTVDTEFGLSMLTHYYRYFTEHELNPDSTPGSPEKHAQVYANLDDQNMFLIGFENSYGGGIDRDYNDMVFSLTLLNPPEIDSITRSPETPNYDQQVTVTAQITKGYADIESVILSYQIDSAIWVNVTMNLEDDFYVADIPAQPYNTAVSYKVYASDTAGNYDISELFSYIVDDFVPPVISNVVHVPTSPYPYQTVTVSSKVTEPADASGIKNVTLWYTEAGTWTFTEMTLHEGLWTATIPRQGGGANVKFFVEAFDNAGNNAETSTFGYTVIIPNLSPTAEFTKSASTVYTGEVIDFDASGSRDPDGYIVSYSWDFGDGNTATGVTVSHSYVDNGEYNVVLRVVDDYGAADRKTASILVKNRPPVAVLDTSSTIVYKEEIVTFNASRSYDPDGTIVSYTWDFGDGNTTTGVTLSHSYPATGTYTVTLTVTDNDGATDTVSVTKTVMNRPPVANFTESAHTAYTDEMITFNATESYDPDGTIVSYLWDFGDGNTATGVTVSHAYADNGSYVVNLTVTDNEGATDSVNATKTINNRAPVASFIESVEVVDTGETVSFDASASDDPDGTIVDYLWDFGDGTTGSGVSIQHAYSQDGTYTVTLTVTDNDGATDTITATKTVMNESPTANFTESAHTVNTGENIHFDASESYDPDGTIISYTWDFGDGNTATGVVVNYAYGKNGEYNVTLTVVDDDGASGSATATKKVLNRSPVALFTEDVTIVSQDEATHFDASESYDPDGTIISYTWDFGDGNTASGVTVDHAYTEDGNYTVTLTVTDDDGATATSTSTKTVETEIVMNSVFSLAMLSVIILAVTALTATLLYALYVRRKKNKKT
jgi:PKD repeat protein